VHTGATGDARGSTTNSLVAEFLGDYNYVAATNDFAYAVWNDVRNAADCPAIDTYRQKLLTGTTPNPVPEPQQDCPPVGTAVFGNSDIFGTRVDDPTPERDAWRKLRGGRRPPLSYMRLTNRLDGQEYRLADHRRRGGRAYEDVFRRGGAARARRTWLCGGRPGCRGGVLAPVSRRRFAPALSHGTSAHTTIQTKCGPGSDSRIRSVNGRSGRVTS